MLIGNIDEIEVVLLHFDSVMTNEINIDQRKPIWSALADLYLDTELDDVDFKRIAIVFVNSPYSLDEILNINKQEVYPILINNLLNLSGVWEGFNEDSLADSILLRLNKHHQIATRLNNTFNNLFYPVFFRYFLKADWVKIEALYYEIKKL